MFCLTVCSNDIAGMMIVAGPEIAHLGHSFDKDLWRRKEICRGCVVCWALGEKFVHFPSDLGESVTAYVRFAEDEDSPKKKGNRDQQFRPRSLTRTKSG